MLPMEISRIRKKTNAKNKGRINGTNILNGLQQNNKEKIVYKNLKKS